MTGTTIAQVIPILASPVLSRLYQPSDFGTFGVYTSITAIAAVIATGKYELAIILPKDDEDSINIIALTVCVSLIVNSILFLLFLFFKRDIILLLKNEGLSNFLLFVPLTIFLMSIYQSLTYWNNRRKNYKRMSVNRVIQSGSTAGFNICMGVGRYIRGGLIYGTIIGQALSTLFLGCSFFKGERDLLKNIKLSRIKEMAARYKKFPKTTTLSAFVNSFFNNGRYLILGFVLESGILGQLLLSFRVLAIPVTIIGDSFADILFQRMSVWNNSDASMEETFAKLKKIMLVLMAIAVFPVLVLFAFGEHIISFVFGNQWTLAGKFSSYLAISIFFQFIASPFCRVFFVIEKHSLYFLWEIMRTIIVFVPIFILGRLNYSYNIIIISMSISISLSYIILLCFLGGAFKCSEKKN